MTSRDDVGLPQARAELWGANLGLRVDELGAGVPPPPYLIKDCTFVMVGVAFHREAVEPLVPRQLQLADQCTGGFYAYTAGMGGGIAPYSCFCAWVDVKGFDSPDGSAGRLGLGSLFSGRAGAAMARIGTVCTTGDTFLAEADGLAIGTATRQGVDVARLTVLPSKQVLPTAAGVHYWLFEDPGGRGLVVCPISFSYELQPAGPLAVEILAPPSDPFVSLRPARLLWGAFLRGGAITFPPTQPIADFPKIDAEESRVALTSLMERLGTAALIVDDQAQAIFMNHSARRLLGEVVVLSSGRLRAARARDQAGLDRGLAAAFATGPEPFRAAPVALARPGGDCTMLASIMPLTDSTTSLGNRARPLGAASRTALIMIANPDELPDTNPAGALQVMGLTPAEARAATLVGTGLSPREAADKLGKAESTIRATLNQVYSKLNLSRQSELAVLVSRLTSLGF